MNPSSLAARNPGLSRVSPSVMGSTKPCARGSVANRRHEERGRMGGGAVGRCMNWALVTKAGEERLRRGMEKKMICEKRLGSRIWFRIAAIWRRATLWMRTKTYAENASHGSKQATIRVTSLCHVSGHLATPPLCHSAVVTLPPDHDAIQRSRTPTTRYSPARSVRARASPPSRHSARPGSGRPRECPRSAVPLPVGC